MFRKYFGVYLMAYVPLFVCIGIFIQAVLPSPAAAG